MMHRKPHTTRQVTRSIRRVRAMNYRCSVDLPQLYAHPLKLRCFGIRSNQGY